MFKIGIVDNLPAEGARAMNPTMIGFGFAVGLLVGITGTGGGSVMTPLLVVVFNINIIFNFINI